jgi:hypothetical protein
VTSVTVVVTWTLILREERLRSGRAFGLAKTVGGVESPSGGPTPMEAASDRTFGVGRPWGRHRARPFRSRGGCGALLRRNVADGEEANDRTLRREVNPGRSRQLQFADRLRSVRVR